MKLILITKEDWSNADLGVRLFNVIFDVAKLTFSGGSYSRITRLG